MTTLQLDKSRYLKNRELVRSQDENDTTDKGSDSDFTEYVYKVMIVGEIGVGKTSLVQRYVFDRFTTAYKATIGVDFALKKIFYDECTEIKLQLWDVAGQERFGNMTRVYYKDAVAAVVVFDLTRPATLQGALKWKRDIDEKTHIKVNGEEIPIPVILVGSKADMQAATSLAEVEADKICKDNGFVAYHEVSSYSDTEKKIDKAMKFLTAKIMENETEQREERATGIRLDGGGRDITTPVGCSC